MTGIHECWFHVSYFRHQMSSPHKFSCVYIYKWHNVSMFLTNTHTHTHMCMCKEHCMDVWKTHVQQIYSSSLQWRQGLREVLHKIRSRRNKLISLLFNLNCGCLVMGGDATWMLYSSCEPCGDLMDCSCGHRASCSSSPNNIL